MKHHFSILLALLLLPACTTHLQRKEQFLTGPDSAP